MSFLSALFSGKNNTGGFIIVAISALTWGTEGVIAQICYGEGMNTSTLLFFRYLVMALIFIIIAKAIGSPILVPKDKRKVLVKLGFLSLATSACVYWSFALMPATLSIFFFYVYPSFACLISHFWNKDRLGWGRIIALFISGLGLLLLYWTSSGTIPTLGVVLALLGALSHSIGINIIGRELTSVNKVSYTASLGLFVTVIFGLFNCFAGKWTMDVSTSGWLYLLLLAVFSTALPTYLYVWGVAIVGAADAAIVYLLEPVSTAITAFIIFGDTLTKKQGGGALLILGAILLQQIFIRIIKRRAVLSQTKMNEIKAKGS